MKTKVHVIYEKLTDLELSILETIENEIQSLKEEMSLYDKKTNEYLITLYELQKSNDIYFAILEDFVNHGKAVEEEL